MFVTDSSIRTNNIGRRNWQLPFRVAVHLIEHQSPTFEQASLDLLQCIDDAKLARNFVITIKQHLVVRRCVRGCFRFLRGNCEISAAQLLQLRLNVLVSLNFSFTILTPETAKKIEYGGPFLKNRIETLCSMVRTNEFEIWRSLANFQTVILQATTS